MPRFPRVELECATYHCIVRGNNREPIFITERDKQDFLRMLMENRQALQFRLLAFALLDNQAHLVIKTGVDPLSRIMLSQLSAYARSFNKYHDRTGHVFQERYQSYLCHEDERLLLLVRYLHQLPVRLGHSHHANLSRWTSHLAYLGDERFGMVDREEVFQLLSNSRDGALRAYQSYMAGISTEQELQRAYVPEEELVAETSSEFAQHPSIGLAEIASFVESQIGVRLEVMRSKSRNEQVVEARRMFIAAAVLLCSLPVSDVAKFLNVHHSYVSRLTFPKNEGAQELAQAAKEMAAALGITHAIR